MSNNDNFFDDTEEKKDVEKVKVGDQEFTPDELSDLVGSGRKLKELEEKQGQPIDDILHSWGKRGETIGELKKQKEEYEKELDKFKNPPAKEEVDREAVRKEVLDEMKGFGFATKEELLKEMNNLYQNNRAGERMLSAVKRVSREATADGKPEIEPEKLLEFMADPNNPKDPQKAYNVMFEKELDEWKLAQIDKAKKPGMIIEKETTAGGKVFEPKKITSKEELTSALRSSIFGEGGQ